MYVNQPIHAEKFESFCQQLSEFTKSLSNERASIDKAMKQMESQQVEAETAFAERVAEEKARFAAQREKLERELRSLTETNDKLCALKREWEEKQEKATEELMAELEREDMDHADMQFGDHFSSLIKSMTSLSYESMKDQFTVIQHNLEELNIEKKQLQVSIADQKNTIEEMKSALVPTCGVTYKECNALTISFLNEVSKVRSEYQKCRLQEQALKAKLST